MKYIDRNDKDPESINILYNTLKEHPLSEQWFEENPCHAEGNEYNDIDQMLFFKIDYYSHHIRRILSQYDKMNKTNKKLKTAVENARKELLLL